MGSPNTKKTFDTPHPVVFNYKPRIFGGKLSQNTADYVNESEMRKSDFKLSDLVSEQTLVAELNQQKQDAKVEELVLARLQSLQEDAYKEAYELGRIEGQQQGFAEQKEFLEDKIARMNEFLKMFGQIKELLVRENEVEIVRMINKVASKIAMRDIKVVKESILDVLATVTKDLQAQDVLQIKMSHEDLMFIESLKERLGRQHEILKTVRLEPADDIEAGGCVVETPYGKMDATVKERIAKIEEALEARLSGMTQDQIVMVKGQLNE